jgi:hypothetical protein
MFFASIFTKIPSVKIQVDWTFNIDYLFFLSSTFDEKLGALKLFNFIG